MPITQSDNLTIAKGEFHFAPYQAGTQVEDGFQYFGNTPTFTLNRDSESLPHYASYGGFKRKDDEIVIEAMLAGSVTVDDISPKNLGFFFMGTSLTTTVSSATGSTSTFLGVKPGRTYQIGATPSSPGGARSIASVVVRDDAGSPTTFDLTDDYTVDLELGLVTVVVGGAITTGTNLVVTYNQTAHTRPRVISGSTEIEGAAKFISRNPKGQKLDYYMPRVKLMPSGDIPLITDAEWMTASFSITALNKGDLELAYIDGRPVA